jgi:hypothetical protein
MTPATDGDASSATNNNGNNTIELMGVSKLRAALEERLDVMPTLATMRLDINAFYLTVQALHSLVYA